MRVLLIEEDPATIASIGLMFAAEGIVYDSTDLGEDGVSIAKHDGDGYDMIVLSLTLPDITGFQVLRDIRAAKLKTPAIVVSGMCGIAEIVKALGHGADDFLAKPFHKDELLARIHAVIRRCAVGSADNIVEFDGLRVDIGEKTASLDGRPIRFTGKEYGMIELLALRKNSVVTKEMFLAHLYQSGADEPELKIIDVFMCKLRAKLKAAAGDERQFIATVWGRGYVLGNRCEPTDVLSGSADTVYKGRMVVNGRVSATSAAA